MSVGTITSLGIGAGIDTQSIVDQLIAAEREPKELRIARDEAVIQAELSAFGVLAAELDKLGSAANALRNQSATRTATLSSDEYFSLSLGSTAVTGEFTATVKSLAGAQTLASEEFAGSDTTVGTGTLTLAVGDESIAITIDSSNNTVRGIADAINEATDSVRAQVLTTDGESGAVKLLLTSATTGLANTLEVTVDDSDGNDIDAAGLSQLVYSGATTNLTERVPAADAVVVFNGEEVRSSTNVFKGLVRGVDLTALLADETKPVQVSVSQDLSSAESAMSGLVRVLNSLSTGLRDQLAYDSATQTAGLLQGDATGRALDQRISDILLSELGSGTLKNLVDIGVSRSLEGEVTLDSAKFMAALEDDFDAVSSLMDAAADAVDVVVDGYGSGAGIIGSRTEALQTRLDGITERRTQLEERMAVTEARIRREFAGLDTLIAQLQTTSSFLATQLDSLIVPGRDTRN